jgi:hypothetical protein
MAAMTYSQAVEKTLLMREIERAYDRDIREVVLDEIASHRTDSAALKTIGRKIDRPLDPSLLSVWIRRLGVLNEAREARMRR